MAAPRMPRQTERPAGSVRRGRRGRYGRQTATALLVLSTLGAAAHLLLADRILLEGAAGKQTHTAMIARNLYRGRGSVLRPIVDDIGKPGYFVKEVPLLPATAALAYHAVGGVDERIGRLLSAAGWLAGVPILAAILGRALPPAPLVVAATWWIVAPLGFTYARAFMTDATMVTFSLGALLALLRLREKAGTSRVAACGAAFGATLLLKPHAVFWLGPAACVLLLARARGEPVRPAPRWIVTAACAIATGSAIAAAWYLHAAAVHRQYPAPGATGLQGWFSAAALLEPALYLELLRQLVLMVFTPLGLLIAGAGIVLDRRRLGIVELALLAWGGGVIAQCLVFDTRLFDDAARGTEYYQLAMIPVAALLIGRGTHAVARRLAPSRPVAATTIILLLLTILAAAQIRPALAVPERYASIARDCAIVQQKTRPHDEVFVLADRGGTILYSCDRRGTTFVPARAVSRVFAHGDNVAGTRQIADALDRAAYVFVPFPDLLGEDSRWLAMFEQSFDRVEIPDTEARLYRRRPGPR